jgi:dodecin
MQPTTQPKNRTQMPNTQTNQNQSRQRDGDAFMHDHRTAKIVELVGCSSKSFDDAIRNVLKDAAETTRGITGCSVEHQSVKCDNGKILEYRVNVKVSFGIERTPPPSDDA